MRKFKTTNGTVVCITKATKKSLVEMTRNFQENPFEFKNVKITICYKNGRFESYSFYNIDKEKISYSTIKSITYFDGTQYLYYGGFFIQPNGEIISSLEEITGNGKEIKVEVGGYTHSEIPPQIVKEMENNTDIITEECYPQKITSPSTKDDIIQRVDFYLTKGRFYEQEDKKMFCECLQDQLDSIKKEVDEDLYCTLMEELQEIKDGTDMVRYYDRGDEKWTTNTRVRKAIAEFTDRFLEDSFLYEFDYMCKTCDFWEIYEWVSENYNIDILKLVGGEEKDENGFD